MPKLVPEEWNAPTLLYTKGGVSLVPKEAIPSVMRSLGFTAAATAMLITAIPSTLGLGSYPHSQVECTIVLNDNSEEKEVRVSRWCVQLGFTAHVFRVAEGPKISLAQTMLRMVCKQLEEFGWPSECRARNITGVLEKHGISLVGISEVQVRSDISNTFLAHTNLAKSILQLSGLDGTFFKVHADSQADFAMVDTFLVWLPDHTTLAAGRQLLDGLSHLGLVCKRRSAPHRFAAKFASQKDAQAFCQKHSFELTSYGRWKLYGLPVATGLAGAVQFLKDQGWNPYVVEHFDAKSLSFLADSLGQNSPLQLHAPNGHAVQIKFKAVNSAARALSQRATASAVAKASASLPSKAGQLGKQQKDFLESVTPQNKRPSEKTGTTPEAQRQKT